MSPALFADDPMLAGHFGLAVVIIVLVKVVLVFVFLLVATMLMIWFERKLISDMQNRIGPNRAGPFGLLQSLADGIKAFFKEDLIPDRADRLVFKLAPFLSLLPALITFSVIPIGGVFGHGKTGVVHIAHHATYLQLADPPIGILLVLAMSSIAVYGIMLAGWSSGSKYPLLGSVRASAQMVSYEAAMGLSVAVVLVSGTLSTHGIVAVAQTDGFWHWNLWETLPSVSCRSSSSWSPARPRNRPGRRSTWSRPSKNWSAASTPSTAASGSRCSTWPSS